MTLRPLGISPDIRSGASYFSDRGRATTSSLVKFPSANRMHMKIMSAWPVQRPRWPPALRSTNWSSNETFNRESSSQMPPETNHPSTSSFADGTRGRIDSAAVRHSRVNIPSRTRSRTAAMLHWQLRHSASHPSGPGPVRHLGSGLFLNPKPQLGNVTCCSLAPDAAGVTETGQFTLNDTVLAGRGLEFSENAKDVDLEQLNSLFAKVGFPKRDLSKLAIALEHTVSLLVVTESEGGRLVAFARATGDAVFNAIIWDVVVDPRYQGSGLGKAVMERLLVQLVGLGICNIALYAEPNVVGFYRPLGFAPDPAGIKGMAYSKRKK